MECANPNAIAIATANIKVTRFIVSPLLLVFLSDRPIGEHANQVCTNQSARV